MAAQTSNSDSVEEMTYPLGAAARLTGLTPDTLRAWERRYGVVVPMRTAGGTRRYRAEDLDRLRLVKAAVDAGHRISDVARLDPAQLARVAEGDGSASAAVDVSAAIVAALQQLDAEEAERLIALQLAALGPARFARQVAVPLLDYIGRAWADGVLCIASEHLATSVLRSLLGASLRPSGTSMAGSAPIVFGTLPGERHEMGLLIAAITAAAAGGRVLYLGADLPVAELVTAVTTSGARAVAISMVSQEQDLAVDQLRALRDALADETEVWAGGATADAASEIRGVSVMRSFEQLEQHVQLLGLGGGRPGL